MPTYRVHTMRSYMPPAEAICCMSYCPKSQKLAVGRADSCIELWNLTYHPYVESTIHNAPEVSVEGVCWCNGRLFSTGYQGTLIEYNLRTLEVAYQAPVTAGPAWCIAANKAETHILVGSEGYVTVFALQEVNFFLDKWAKLFQKRVMCISGGPDVDHIVCASGNVIKVWNVTSGWVEGEIRLPSFHLGRELTVWSLAVNDDFTIVSGDSRGMVCFWDGKQRVLKDSIGSHRADVLSVSFNKAGDTVYAAGVDPNIVCFCRVLCKGKEADRVNHKWVKSIQRHLHSHDVRALLVVDELLISGGLDAHLSLSQHAPRRYDKYTPLEQISNSQVCRYMRLLLLRQPKHLEVWRLGGSADEVTPGVNQDLALTRQPQRYYDIRPKAADHIICCAISPNGRWVALSTTLKTSLCQFQTLGSHLNLDELHFICNSLDPACHLAFVSDKVLVLLGKNGTLNLYSTKAQLLCTVEPPCKGPVHLMAVSPPSCYVAIADTSGQVIVFKSEDLSLKCYCILPKYKCIPSAMTINPTTCTLWVAYVDKHVVEFCLESKEYTPFSRALQNNFPKEWLLHPFPITTITFDQKCSFVTIFHDDKIICIVDRNKAMKKSEGRKNKKRESPLNMEGFCIMQRFKHIAYFGAVRDDEALCLEVVPRSFENQLPPALFQSQFGT